MTKSIDAIHPVDAYAGKQLRQARLIRGLSQQELGAGLQRPVTFQQVQKYERGTNRISVSRLYEFAELLRLPCSYFIPGSEALSLPVLSMDEAQLLERYRQFPTHTQVALHAFLDALGSR